MAGVYVDGIQQLRDPEDVKVVTRCASAMCTHLLKHSAALETAAEEYEATEMHVGEEEDDDGDDVEPHFSVVCIERHHYTLRMRFTPRVVTSSLMALVQRTTESRLVNVCVRMTDSRTRGPPKAPAMEVEVMLFTTVANAAQQQVITAGDCCETAERKAEAGNNVAMGLREEVLNELEVQQRVLTVPPRLDSTRDVSEPKDHSKLEAACRLLHAEYDRTILTNVHTFLRQHTHVASSPATKTSASRADSSNAKDVRRSQCICVSVARNRGAPRPDAAGSSGSSATTCVTQWKFTLHSFDRVRLSTLLHMFTTHRILKRIKSYSFVPLTMKYTTSVSFLPFLTRDETVPALALEFVVAPPPSVPDTVRHKPANITELIAPAKDDSPDKAELHVEGSTQQQQQQHSSTASPQPTPPTHKTATPTTGLGRGLHGLQSLVTLGQKRRHRDPYIDDEYRRRRMSAHRVLASWI